MNAEQAGSRHPCYLGIRIFQLVRVDILAVGVDDNVLDAAADKQPVRCPSDQIAGREPGRLVPGDDLTVYHAGGEEHAATQEELSLVNCTVSYSVFGNGEGFSDAPFPALSRIERLFEGDDARLGHAETVAERIADVVEDLQCLDRNVAAAGCHEADLRSEGLLLNQTADQRIEFFAVKLVPYAGRESIEE